MSSARLDQSFFKPKKSCHDKLYDYFVWAYEHSPINFSTITGLHHPDLPRLSGNLFTGRLKHASKDGGAKFSDELDRLAQLALKDKRGIAYCSYATTPVIFIANPAYIEQVSIHNDRYTDRGALLGVFNYIFGEHNIFGLDIQSNSALWREKRNELKSWVFNDEFLGSVTPKMQDIIDDYIKQFEKQSDDKSIGRKIPSVEKFMLSLAMDLFTCSVLDTPSLKDSVSTISKALTRAIISSSNVENSVLLKLSAIAKYFHLKTTGALDIERNNLESIVTESYLKPNQELLTKTRNILQKHFIENTGEQKLKQAYTEAAGLLLVGHETTSRLLQFTLMLLANHPEVVKKIRDELEKFKPDHPWTRDDLNKLVYTTKVLKESLRLYPPAPIIPRIANESFVIADIPRCKTREEYMAAMEQRDKTKDIIVAKGTYVMISPFITHRLASVHTDPLEFKPERFSSSDISTHHDCTWFPFGLGRRDCPGRKIAMQEALLTLVKLVDKYDFDVSIQNPSDKLFEVITQGTLKHKGEVQAEFKPRKSNSF